MTFYLHPLEDNPKPQEPDEKREFAIMRHHSFDWVARVILTGEDASELQTQLDYGWRYEELMD